MSDAILAASLLLRVIALVWSVIIVRRWHDWRLFSLPVVFAVTIVRQAFTPYTDAGTPWRELSELAISVFSILAMYYVDRFFTRSKRANESKKEAEARYATLVESSADGAVVLQDGVVKFINAQGMKMTGYTNRADVLNRPLIDFISPVHRELVAERYRKRLAGEDVPSGYEVGLLHKNGTVIPVEVSASLIQYEGKPATLSLVRDISERKLAEEKLRTSEEHYRTLITASPDGIATLGMDGNVTYACKKLLELFGFGDTSEVVGRSAFDWIAAEDRDRARANISRVSTGEDLCQNQYRLVRKDGSLFWGEISSSLMKDGAGNALGMVSIIRDVTERKQLEEALKESEERFSKAFHSSPVAMVLGSLPEGRVIDVNKRALDIAGYSREELIGRTSEELNITPNHSLREDVIRRLEKGQNVTDIETTIRTKAGELHHILFSNAVVLTKEKPFAISTMVDITERKRAEAEIAYKSRLVATVNDAVLASDEKFVLTEWNPAAERIYGWKAEEVLGRSGQEVLRSEFIGIERATALKTLADTGELRCELIQYHKDGHQINIESTASALKDTSGRTTGYVSANRDITERKLAEERLRLSEEMFSNVFRIGPTGMIITRVADGKFIDANESFCRMFEFNLNEVIGHTSTELNMWTLEERKKLIQKQLESGGLSNFELVARSKSGKLINVLISSKFLQLNGEDCLLTNLIDVTERKRTEEALRLSEENYRNLTEGLPVGIAITTEGGRTTFANQAFLHMRGYDSLEELLKVPMSERYYDLEDRERWLAALREQGRVVDFEVRLKRKDGSDFWVLSSAIPFATESGEKSFLSVTRDITVRKQAQEIQRKSEEKFRTLVENIPQKIFHKDADLVYISCNAHYARDLKIEPEKIEGKTDFDFFPKDLAEKYRADDRRVIESGKLEDIEERYIQDGQQKIVHTVKAPVRDERGKVTGIIGIFWDVTERYTLMEQLVAQDRMVSLGQLVAGVAHEINNPLTSVIGFSDILMGVRICRLKHGMTWRL